MPLFHREFLVFAKSLTHIKNTIVHKVNLFFLLYNSSPLFSALVTVHI